MLRKAVFDICRPYIDDANFLDLFAGTGAMGFEALSQGATHATFIDSDQNAIKTIHDNAAALKVQDRCTIIKGSLPSALKRLQDAFQIIYIDPPYSHFDLEEFITHLDKSALLAPASLLFVETDHPLPVLPLEHLSLKEIRKFGSSLLHQYVKYS